MIRVRSAASSTVRVSGPTVSSEKESGIAPARETRPYVGLIAEVPQKAAGRRMEPPVSEPRPAKLARAATEAPAPDDEPPGMRSTFQGLRQWP
jgi:hypothetical protein